MALLPATAAAAAAALQEARLQRLGTSAEVPLAAAAVAAGLLGATAALKAAAAVAYNASSNDNALRNEVNRR